jgi:hypothetical protein
MKRYLTKSDRGLVAPKRSKSMNNITITEEVPKSSKFLPGTNGIFQTTDPHPCLIERPKLLLGEKYRTAHYMERARSCNRNYTNQRWLYNKTQMHEFDERFAKRDVRRGKDFRKITRREDKENSLKTIRSVN